jgi:hypothetical protein
MQYKISLDFGDSLSRSSLTLGLEVSESYTIELSHRDPSILSSGGRKLYDRELSSSLGIYSYLWHIF